MPNENAVAASKLSRFQEIRLYRTLAKIGEDAADAIKRDAAHHPLWMTMRRALLTAVAALEAAAGAGPVGPPDDLTA